MQNFACFLHRNNGFEEAIEAAKVGVYWGNSPEALDFLEYCKSKEATLDGNLGYHLQQSGRGV